MWWCFDKGGILRLRIASHRMTTLFCDFVLLSAAWQWIGNTRISEILTDFRDYKGHVWCPSFSKHDSSSNNNKRTVPAIFTLSVCKKQFRPGTSKSWFHFLVNDVNPVFGNRPKNHQKSFRTISIFWEKTSKNSSNHGNSFMLHFAPEKILYKNVNSWIQRNMLFCNTWMNLDHKIISSFYHIKFPLFTKEICTPKNSSFVWRHLG